MTKPKLKKDLVKQAKALGLNPNPITWTRNKLEAEILKKLEYEAKQQLISVESMAEEVDRTLTSPSPEKTVKGKKRVKLVDVYWCGTSQVHHHSPPNQPIKIRFERTRPTNIYHELWRQLGTGRPDQDETAKALFKVYSKYYIEEAKRGSFWRVVERLGPVPIRSYNDASAEIPKKTKDILNQDGEDVLLYIRDFMDAEEPLIGRSKMEFISMAYNMEIEGMHRRTILDRLKDCMDEIEGRDHKTRRTQL